jgi:hypothetical protein
MVALAVLLFLTEPLSRLPNAVLAAIVFLIGVKLIDIRGLAKINRESRAEFSLALFTAATVVFIGVKEGIILAVVLSLLAHVRHGYRPHTAVLVRARTADSAIVVLARLESVPVAQERLTITGGVAIGSVLRRELARDPELSVAIRYPGQRAGPVPGAVGTIALPFLDLAGASGPSAPAGSPGNAEVIVARSSRTLAELQRGLDRWFLAGSPLIKDEPLRPARCIDTRGPAPLA